jgi:tetratricopeptide (TPR) repeat protein
MKKIYIIACCIFQISILCHVSAFAKSETTNSKVLADSAYAKENYVGAAKMYEALLKNNHNTVLYYNLGNCYYRLDDIPRAILNFERALLLSPGNADVRHNLDLARSKTIDKVTPASEMFFITWIRQMIDWQSADGWGKTALISFVLMLLSILLYFFSAKIPLKKTGFFASCFLLLVVVLSNVFAYNQRDALIKRSGAIVMASSVSVKSTPTESGTDVFVLHEGTRVEVTDDSMQQWKEIKVADGKVGWIPVKSIERI